MNSSPLGDLPASLALEVDALCDDFERHWRRAQRCRTLPPSSAPFIARATPAAQPALRRYLADLEHELRSGLALPEVPGLILEEEIGRGGMGVVYRARRQMDGRAVALKLIPGAEHARWARWLAELADLRHPNLVHLEGFGTHRGLHFVVMPLVPGGDLKEHLGQFVIGRDGAPNALEGLAALLGKVAGAVAFLHSRGILHRDLKPSNILLAGTDGREPLVCDFGLADRLDTVCPESPGVVGTPSYMAPEQRAGRPLSAAADVWGLGAMLYELLTGRPPTAPSRVHNSRQPEEPVAPRLVNPGVDEALERICLRCLEREPAARYAAVTELVEDLRRYRETNREPSRGSS